MSNRLRGATMTTGGAQSNWSEGKRLSEEPERGTIAALVALAVLVGGERWRLSEGL